MHPRVVGITDTMLLADTADRGRNVGVPRRTHTREQVVLHLMVEATRQVSRHKRPVGRRRLHLRLEPANGLSTIASAVCRITVGMFKVVRESKQNSQGQAGTSTHDHNVCQHGPGESLVLKGSKDIGVNVQNAQKDGILAASGNVVVVKAHTDRLGSTLLQSQNFRVEDRRQPVSSQDQRVVERLEVVVEATFGVTRRVIIEQKHGLRSITVGIFHVVVGVGMVL